MEKLNDIITKEPFRLEDFAEYLRNEERAENTIDTYSHSVRLFYSLYGEANKKNMLDFKRRQLEKWSPKTANNRVIAMNQYCKFIGHPEYCIKGIKIHHATAAENVITVQEYEKLLEGLWADGNEKGYWMVKYLAKTGARASEFVRMDKGGIDKGYCEMWTKGKIRRIYIPKALIEESRKYFSKVEGDLLFPSRYGGQMTTRGVAEDIHRWAKKYGVRPEAAHPHAFRHLYAIQFLKSTKDISLLADLMGHSSVSTTSIYLRQSTEEQMRQLDEAMSW